MTTAQNVQDLIYNFYNNIPNVFHESIKEPPNNSLSDTLIEFLLKVLIIPATIHNFFCNLIRNVFFSIFFIPYYFAKPIIGFLVLIQVLFGQAFEALGTLVIDTGTGIRNTGQHISKMEYCLPK
nr:uncharacterized protein LOC111420986 [Onthophagus taurus]